MGRREGGEERVGKGYEEGGNKEVVEANEGVHGRRGEVEMGI